MTIEEIARNLRGTIAGIQADANTSIASQIEQHKKLALQLAKYKVGNEVCWNGSIYWQIIDIACIYDSGCLFVLYAIALEQEAGRKVEFVTEHQLKHAV